MYSSPAIHGSLPVSYTHLSEFADALRAWQQGNANPLPPTLPGIVAGVRGMRFIDRVIESNRKQSWVAF